MGIVWCPLSQWVCLPSTGESAWMALGCQWHGMQGKKACLAPKPAGDSPKGSPAQEKLPMRGGAFADAQACFRLRSGLFWRAVWGCDDRRQRPGCAHRNGLKRASSAHAGCDKRLQLVWQVVLVIHQGMVAGIQQSAWCFGLGLQTVLGHVRPVGRGVGRVENGGRNAYAQKKMEEQNRSETP